MNKELLEAMEVLEKEKNISKGYPDWKRLKLFTHCL